MKRLTAILCFGRLGCQSTPYDHVRAGPSYPPGTCQEVGQVIGNAAPRKNAREQSYDDLRANAARLDANYVRIIAVAAYATSVRGIAYRCQ